MLTNMDSNKDYAVLIPVHQANDGVIIALRSVERDVPSDVEIICVLHKPSTELRSMFQTNPIFRRTRVIESHKPNLSGVLNEALRSIEQSWIFRMDSDDVWLPGRFKTQLTYKAKFPDISVLAGGISVINLLNDGRYDLSVDKPTRIGLEELRFGCPIKHPTVLMNRKKVLKIGGYNANLKAAEDYDLWSRMAKNHNILLIPEILVEYKVHEESNSFVLRERQSIENKFVLHNIDRMRFGMPRCRKPHKNNKSFLCQLSSLYLNLRQRNALFVKK